MKIQITLTCPCCQGSNINKNGTKSYGKQNYLCKDCRRQFVGDHNLTHKGSHSQADQTVWKMSVRGNGIRDICAVTGYSKDKVQAALRRSSHQVTPKRKHYPVLEVDEFYTFVGNKRNKLWLIYAYCRQTGEMVTYVWGRRDAATVRALKRRLQQLEVSCNRIASDNWPAFTRVFAPWVHLITGKRYTVGIEGNNCRIRHRISRAVRKSCCFSKKLLYHRKVFDLGFFYIANSL